MSSLSIPAGVDKIYYAGSKIAFNDPGDSVVLKDLAGTIIDMMSYGSDTFAFSPSVHKVANSSDSLERIEPGLDTDSAADWKEKVPTPGYDEDPVPLVDEISPTVLSTPEPSSSPTPLVKKGGSSISPEPTPTPELSVTPEPTPSPTPSDNPTPEISPTSFESPSVSPLAE